MKSAAGSNKSKRKGGFPSLLSRAKGNPFSSRRIPTKQGQQGKLEPTVPKHPPAPVAKIKFTKAKPRGKDDDDDRDSSKMSSLSDHDEMFRLMKESGKNPAPTTVTLTTNTPQKELTKTKVQPAPAQETVVAVPAVVTAQVAANKSNMETITMNVNANGIVAVNKDKKDDSPSLPSSQGSSQFSYGKAFQGDNSHSPHQSVTKTAGAVVLPFENHLMFDKQALRPQQEQPPPRQPPQQQQQRPTAVAVATTTHHHLHQPFVPPKFEKVMPMTKAETQEKIMDRKSAPPSPITLDRVAVQGNQEHLEASSMARAQSQPQAAPATNAQEQPKTPVSLVKDRSKNPDSLLERSKTTVSLLEKSKMPLSLLEKSKNPGNLLGKSQTPFSLLERSKVAVSSLKGKSQTPVSSEETAALKSREQKQQPQQSGAEYTHLAITDAAVITEFMSVVAVKKGLPQNYSDESSPTVPGTPQKNDLVRNLVRKINASSESSPIMHGTPKGDDLARNMAFDKVTALLNRLNPSHTANSEPLATASDSTREQLPRVAYTSSASASSSEPQFAASHSATFQQNDVVATTSATQNDVVATTSVTDSANFQQNNSVATTSTSEQGSIATMEKRIVDGLTAATASALDQHVGGLAKDPTPRARDEQTVEPFEFPQSPPKASERSGMETPQDAPTSPSVSRVPVDAPEYFCLTEIRDPELEKTAAVTQLPKTLAADERNTKSKDCKPTKSSNTTTTDRKERATTQTIDENALESLKNDFKPANLMQTHEKDAQFTSDKAAGRDSQQRFSGDQTVINVQDELVMSSIFKSSKSTSAETKQRVDDSSETKQSIVDCLAVEEKSARGENKSVINVEDSASKESKTPTATRLMLSVKTNAYDDSSDEDIPAPVVNAAAMMAALESTLPPRSTVNRKKSTSPRKKGKSPRKSKKQAGAANPPSPLTESNDMKETLRRKAEKKAEKHKSQHGQQKGVMTEVEARFLARQAMENATKSKLDSRDPPPESDLNVHPLKEVVFSCDETVSDLDQSIQKFPVKNIVVEESSNVSLLDQSKKDLDINTNVSNDEERDRYAPLISPEKDDYVKEKQVDESKRQSPRQALADSITEWSIEEVETEDTGEVAVEVMLNSCNQIPLGQRLVQRWFGQKAVLAKVAVKAQSTAVETKGLDKEEKEKDTPEDLLSDQLMPDHFQQACGRKEYKVPPVQSQKSTVKLPDTTPVASNARKPTHFFAHDTSEEEDSVNDEMLEQGSVAKPNNLREPLGREPIPSLDLQSHNSIAPKEPDGIIQLLYQSGDDPSVAASGERSSVLMKEQEAQSCLDLYHADSDIDRYHAMEETPTAKSRYGPKEPPVTAKGPLIPLGQIQEQERDLDYKSASSDQIAGEQDTSLVRKIVDFGHNMMCLSPSSQNDVKNAMRVLGPASLVLLERSIRKAEQGKKDNFTDSISQDPSRESKHSIEVSIIEDNEEIEVGPLAIESAGDACPSSKNSSERDATPDSHVLSPTSQDLLKRSIREADEKKSDEENEDIALEALIKDVTEGLSLGSSKLENTNEYGVSGAILERSVGKQSQNDELFAILKADSSHSKKEKVTGAVESKSSESDGHGVKDTDEITKNAQQERSAHSELELIDLTGVDSADDVDDGVWLFDLSPKNDLTDGFLQSNSEDSLKDFTVAQLGPDNKTVHLTSALSQSRSDLASPKNTAAAQRGSEDKPNCVNDTPNLLMANLEDIIEYASKLLLLSNDDQDKAVTKSSLVVVQGVDVSFGETAEVNGLEVANTENKAIDFGMTKLVEPTEIKEVDLDHTDKQIVKPTQAKTADLIQADVKLIEPTETNGERNLVDPNEAKENAIEQATPTEKEASVPTDGLVSSPMKAIDLTDMEPIETIDCTDMASVHSGEAIGLTVTKPARSEAVNVAERSLSSSRIEDAKSNEIQGTSDTESNVETNLKDTVTGSNVETDLKDTVTHPSGKGQAETMDCERSMKEGQVESKNDGGDIKEELQVEITVEEVDEEDERMMVKDGDRDEREGLKIGASEDKTSEKSEVQVDATELREDEAEEKTPVDATELLEVETEKKTSVVVTTLKRDILDIFFESTEMFLCGPSQHDAVLRDGGESVLQGDGDDGAQGSLAPSSDSQSPALLRSAIPLDKVPESQPCEQTKDSISEESQVIPHGSVSSTSEIPVSGDVSTPDLLGVGGIENDSTTPTLSLEDVDRKDRDDQSAEATNVGETSVENEEGSIPNNDDTSPSNSKDESPPKGFLDYFVEDGEGIVGAGFLANDLYENVDGSRNNESAPIEEDDSGRLESGVSTDLVPDAKQDLSKRKKAPVPEDRLPQRIVRQKKAPVPEDRPSMELRADNTRSGTQPFSANEDKEEFEQRKSPVLEERVRENSNPRLLESRPEIHLATLMDADSRAIIEKSSDDKQESNDDQSSQDSIYTSGSKTPSVVSERNTSRAPQKSHAFAPKPEIAPTRRIQQKQVRRAPTPETHSLEMGETRAVEVIDVEAQSIKEKNEMQRSTKREEVIVCSSSIGDEIGGHSGGSHEDVIDDWLNSIPSSTSEKETAGVDLSTMGEESGEDQYGIQSSISEEVDSRSELLASINNTSERDSASFAAETQQLTKGESHTGHALADIASAAALALIAQGSSQSSNEEMSIRTLTSEDALAGIAAAAALALTAQVSQSSKEEVSIRSSTSEEEVVDIFSRYAVHEADSTTDWEGTEVVEVRDHSVSESDAVLERHVRRSEDGEKAAEKTEIVARADSNSSVDTPQMTVDKESSTALCRNEELWIDFPCIGQHAEIDQQAEQYAEIDQQATNDESQGTSEGGTDDESRVVNREHFSLALGSLATRAIESDLQATNDESRGITEGETVGESVFNKKSLYLALGSMETQTTEIEQHATAEGSYTEGGTVDESSALHEEKLVETQNLCWVPWPMKSPGNDFSQANATETDESTQPQTEEKVASKPLEVKTRPIEETATRNDKYGEPRGNDQEGQPGTLNACWLSCGPSEKLEANSAGCVEADNSTENDEANADGSAKRVISAAAAAVVVEGAAEKLMSTEANKEGWNESTSEELSNAEDSASLEAHEINANTANKSIDREGRVDILAVTATSSLGTAADAEISNKPPEDASYTKEVASPKTKSTASVSSKASVQSEKSKSKSTASLKAKSTSLAASAKPKSPPSPRAKPAPSTLGGPSKVKTNASSKAMSRASLPSKEALKDVPVVRAADGAARLTKASSDSSSRRRWSGSLAKSSRSQSRIQTRSPQGTSMDKSKADAISLRSRSSRSTSRNGRASIPQEISITEGEADASSTVVSTTSSMNVAGPGTDSSVTTASSVSVSQKYRDIKSTPASQEHFLVPLAIAAQRSKQEAEQVRSSYVASSLASKADVMRHEGQLNISRFGSTSGEEPLDAPPPRASASLSSKQHSDFSPTSGRREEATFSRFGSISGDESVHAPPAHSFSSEAAMQNSLASPVSENNPTSPKGSTFFSRIEEGPEEIESQSECTSSVDETSLLLALTRSETEEQDSSPTSEEKVDTAVQDDASRDAAALDAAAAVVVDKTPRSGSASKRSILQRMRATSLVSGTRSKASSQPLAGVSKTTTRVERERVLLSALESSSLGESGERSSIGNISSTESVTESVTESEKIRARKAFLRAPRLQTVLDRLRTRKGDGDSDSVASSNAGPVEIRELFTRYDSIVKHMVVFDESRLQSQTPTVIDVTDISTQRSPSCGSVGSVTNTDGRASPQITDLTDRCTSSPDPIYVSSTSSSDDKDDNGSEKETMTTEERRLMESDSSYTTTETTTPSQKARNLRQQLDQALHTSTMIRDTQERLGAELNTFKSRLEQQRRNGSPQRYGSPQRSIVLAPPTTESISTITNSTTVEPSTATIDVALVPSSSVSFQSRIDRVEQKRSKALLRSKAVELKRSQARASPTFDQVASAFDQLKSGRNQSESPKTSDEDAIAVRKIAESAGKALLDEDNDSSSDDEDKNYADDDRIKKATVHGEFVENDEVQLQNLESIIENLRDAEERKREVTSRRIEEAKRSVTGSSASLGLSSASSPTASIPVISIEFDTEFR